MRLKCLETITLLQFYINCISLLIVALMYTSKKQGSDAQKPKMILYSALYIVLNSAICVWVRSPTEKKILKWSKFYFSLSMLHCIKTHVNSLPLITSYNTILVLVFLFRTLHPPMFPSIIDFGTTFNLILYYITISGCLHTGITNWDSS